MVMLPPLVDEGKRGCVLGELTTAAESRPRRFKTDDPSTRPFHVNTTESQRLQRP